MDSIPRGREPRFAMVYQKSIDWLIEAYKPDALTERLMFLLIRKAKYNGLIYETQRQIAKSLGSSVGRVNQGIKCLKEIGFLTSAKKPLKISGAYCQVGRKAIKKPEQVKGLIDTSTGEVKRFKRAN